MSYCYILFSQKLDRFYIGATTQTPENRLEKHNQHSYGNHHFTAKADDWKEFLINGILLPIISFVYTL